MINQITITDFKNPYLVFAAEGTGSETFLNELIAEYQEEILKDILGVQLYNEMEDNLTDEFWINFLGGVTYDSDSISYKYKGIKSILCRIVFYHWHWHKNNALIPEGAMIIKQVENMKVIPISDMNAQYNKAVDLIDNSIPYDATVYRYIQDNYSGDIAWIPNKIEKQNLLDI